MGDIDFLSPEQGEPHPKKKPAQPDGTVEYTPGERLGHEPREKRPQSLAGGVARQKLPSIKLPPAPERPKVKRHFFSLWRRQRKAQQPLAPVKLDDHLLPKPTIGADITVPAAGSQPTMPTTPPVPALKPMPPLITPLTPSPTAAKVAPTKPAKIVAASKFIPPKGHKSRMDVNLIPAHLLTKMGPPHRFRDLGLVALVVITVILLIEGGFIFYGRKIDIDITQIDEAIADVKGEISTFAKTQQAAAALNEQLGALDKILAGHIYWTNFFEFIEEQTLPTVYYENMTGSALTGEFTFNAVTTDFQQVQTQIALFKAAAPVETVSVTAVERKTVVAASASATAEPGTPAVQPAGEENIATAPANVTFRLNLRVKSALFTHNSL